jgi:tRNA modification GTPase
MVVFFEGPKSFTGDDVAELFIHGGVYTLQLVVADLLEYGCRQALAGEFSFRAVRNGKLSIDQAQAVHRLISATNASAHRLALASLQGDYLQAFSEIAEGLRRVLALAETGIDFSDQDIPELELGRLSESLASTIDRLKRISGSIDRGRRIQEGVSLALAGLPNAGKSTLFNRLIGTDRSIVSDEPGTTRDLVREYVRLRSSSAAQEATFWLQDTAGLRENAGSVERKGIELARKAVLEADIVVFVASDGMLSDDLREWESLGRPGHKGIVVINKSDLWIKDLDLLQIQKLREDYQRHFETESVFFVSAQEDLGLESLRDEMVRRAGVLDDRGDEDIVLTTQDQWNAVEQAVLSLERARRANAHDTFSADLRVALDQLSFFIGQTRIEEILGRIFSQFCIGK